MRKSTPLLTLVLYGSYAIAAGAYSIYYGLTTWWQGILLLVVALLGWTLTEYFVHRYLYHLAGETPLRRYYRYLLHGHHHRHPGDIARMFMPPVPGTIILILLFWIFRWLFADYAYWLFSGYAAGFLWYDMMHYAIHSQKKPPTFLRPLFEHHFHHHNRFPDKAFGVTTRIWDRFFGTMPPKGI